MAMTPTSHELRPTRTMVPVYKTIGRMQRQSPQCRRDLHRGRFIRGYPCEELLHHRSLDPQAAAVSAKRDPAVARSGSRTSRTWFCVLCCSGMSI